MWGGYGGGVTPLPIPNREVKPSSADGTARETGWESWTPPSISQREPRCLSGSGVFVFRGLGALETPRSWPVTARAPAVPDGSDPSPPGAESVVRMTQALVRQWADRGEQSHGKGMHRARLFVNAQAAPMGGWEFAGEPMRTRMAAALILLIALAPVPLRAQPLLTPERVQEALERTDQRTETAGTAVAGADNEQAETELEAARGLQAQARSELAAARLRIAIDRTLRARARADRAISLTQGLPDPDRVLNQL